MPFNDRSEAGQKLAKALSRYRHREPVILALPRGGVPVAAEIASALDAPLDLVLVRKIGVPFQPELAMGAVIDGGAPLIVRNEDVIESAGIGEREFKATGRASTSFLVFASVSDVLRRHKMFPHSHNILCPQGCSLH